MNEKEHLSNLQIMVLQDKCNRQYETIVKLQDEKIDLFKENQQLKEVIEEVREYTEELKPHWLGNNLVLKIIDDLLQILDKAEGEDNG